MQSRTQGRNYVLEGFGFRKGSEGRPDASSAVSIFAGCFPKAAIGDVFDVNEILCQVRHFVVADSSFETKGVDKPQHGWLQGITTTKLNQGASAEVSLLGWRSRRTRCTAGNTLLRA